MTTFERNFNGTVYSFTVKEEERKIVMGESTEESTVKVISVEVKVATDVGQERGVLLQHWQQEAGEGEWHQVNKV